MCCCRLFECYLCVVFRWILRTAFIQELLLDSYHLELSAYVESLKTSASVWRIHFRRWLSLWGFKHCDAVIARPLRERTVYKWRRTVAKSCGEAEDRQVAKASRRRLGRIYRANSSSISEWDIGCKKIAVTSILTYGYLDPRFHGVL